MARSDARSPKADRARQTVAAARATAAFQLGLSAESRAAAYLVGKGFRILSRHWKSPVGEIDIVSRRRNLLVFVEVKARDKLDEAAAAEAWLAATGARGFSDIRFDAILVAPGKLPKHIQGRFET